MKIEKLLLGLALAMLIASAAFAQKPVQVTWDPPAPENAPDVEGYRVWKVAITPALKPADYAVNLVSPLPAEYTVTKELLGTTPAGTYEFTIEGATPGLQVVVTAFNSTWGNSPDSDVLTLRPAPPKPGGVRAVALIIEASKDLAAWVPFQVLEAALGKDQFFRLGIRK